MKNFLKTKKKSKKCPKLWKLAHEGNRALLFKYHVSNDEIFQCFNNKLKNIYNYFFEKVKNDWII